MSKLDLDREITAVFKSEVADIYVGDRVKRDIDKVIEGRRYGEGKVMKRVNIKKMTMLGVACVMLSATVICAKGKVTSLISGSNIFAVCRDYSKLNKQEEKLGYNVNIIEKFSNGYIFDNMEVCKVKGIDKLGNVVETYKELDVEYKNELGECISVNADQRNVGRGFETPIKTLECDDTVLYYYLDTYKFVPEDYELTEEDKINMERDDYEISSGSEEIEIRMMSSVIWEKESVRYHLLAIDTSMTADEMLEMAREMIKE